MSGTPGMSEQLEPNVGLLGWAVAIFGAAMATMPFLGPLIGVPMDGSAAWQWTVDRGALHVVPGLMGVTLGLLVVWAARGLDRGPRALHERSLVGWLGMAVLAVGGWMIGGPWIYDLMVPGAGHSGLMFLAAPGWTRMSPAHQLALESVCHWAPGIVTALSGSALLGLVRWPPGLQYWSRPPATCAGGED